MTKSMTGFASKTLLLKNSDGTQTHLTIMIKTLNARFLETVCKLPSALSVMETDLIKLFKKKLHRGNVIFTAQMSNPNLFKSSVVTDTALLQNYLQAIKTIKKKSGITDSLSLEALLRLPNIFSTEEQTIDKQAIKKVLKAVDDLIIQLNKTREQEGTALEKDVAQRIKNLQKCITAIEKTAHQTMKQRTEKVQEKIAELDPDEKQAASTQRSALYLELDKIDIHEEIVRFKNHIDAFAKHLSSNNHEKGRRLDFIIQELGREANTIAAKCADSKTSNLAIDMKVELEKAREQVQNIV